MKYFMAVFILLLPPLVTCAADTKAKETPHYDVVAEYIRSLGAIYNIQQMAEKEYQDENVKNNPTQLTMNGIRSSTRYKLELSSSIAALKRMTLKEPIDTLNPTIISFYEEKIKLHDELIKISNIFLDAATKGAAKPGVDYSNLLAGSAEITASMEYLDEDIFKSMVLVFALLIDYKPDSEGHMSHLIITKAERQKLIDDINHLFGESLDKENKSYTVGSAAVLKGYLLKDYKCVDEWQH
jgi:hypothetical protein